MNVLQHRMISQNKARILLIVLCFIALIWGGVRACSQVPLYGAKHTYVIARDPTWYPLDLGGKDSNVLAFSNDLILTIAKRQNIDIVLISVGYNSLFEGLDDEKYGAVMTSMMPTAMSMRVYNFSDPFFFVGPVLIVPKDSDLDSLKEMDNRIIGVRSGNQQSADTWRLHAYYKYYDTTSEAFNDLYHHHIDGILMPVLEASAYIETFYPNEFKIITKPLNNTGLRLAGRKTAISLYLISQFNEGLNELIQNGTYSILLKKWGLPDPRLEKHGDIAEGSSK